MAIVEVKILSELVPVLLRKRQEVGQYSTTGKAYRVNREVKLIDTFFCLKSVTTTGLIKNYGAQLDQLLYHCKISRATFLKRLSALEQMGLLKRNDSDITLASYKKLLELYDLDDTALHQTTIILYDQEQKKQTIEWHIRNIELEQNIQHQKRGLNKKIAENPASLQIRLALIATGSDPEQLKDLEYFQDQLQRLQISEFAQGTNRKNPLFEINPFIARNTASIRNAHNLKSNRSVTYLKRQLEKRGLRIFKRFGPVLSNHCSHLPDDTHLIKYTPGKPGEKGKTAWYIPDVPAPSKHFAA